MTSDPKLAPRDSGLQAERHAALRRLAASLSHALGTPLNVISGRAELIELDTQDLPEVLDSAVTIRRQVERITRLLKGTLRYIDALEASVPGGNVIPSGNVSELVEELRAAALAAGWRAEFNASGREAAVLPRIGAVRGFVLGVCRLAAELQQTTRVQFATTASGLQATVQLSPGLRIVALRTALEPWLEADEAAPPGANGAAQGQVLTATRAVQLAIALGCARDAGAELELIQSATHTDLSATWRA